MRTVNLSEARTHLSRLVRAAAGGEPFVIARAGKPLVKVVAPDPPEPRSRIGFHGRRTVRARRLRWHGRR